MGGPHPPLPTIEGQTYCLRWNNHKSNLVEILDALIKVESYVDCTIVVDDQVHFKAHRVVLAANSPYFQAILQDVPMDHCSIIFPGVKAFEMRALLDYMYTGEVNVTQSQIPTIMRIAEELEVKGLFDMADLKEKFNKLSEEHADRASHGYPYAAASTSSLTAPYAMATSSSSAQGVHNGKDHHAADLPIPSQHNSSSVISTSSHISPSAAATSTSSPPYTNYKSPYTNLYSKSPGPSNGGAPTGNGSGLGQTKSANTPQTPTHSQAQAPNADHAQWPLSPSAAVGMLGSVYDSVPDNPLKRKKLSSMTSMLMNRDTPILRNVLAQANPADSSQPISFSMPAASKADNKSNTDKNSPHGGHNNNHGQHFNGTEYGSDKKYHDEPHSPYTDRSFDDDGYDAKGNYGGGFSSNANQKPEWKRYKQYTRSDIMSAIQCVREGMSALQASRKFGVPSRTLYDKVKKLGITTGRPMNRTMKRSPSNVDSTAAFSYPHGYGAEPLMSSMHEGRSDEREPKDHHRTEHHHMPPQLPHSLLDHALLQQALESRGGDIAGRGALLLAAAAHAAANRISTSPGPNGSSAMRSPSPPNYGRKYGRGGSEQDYAMERDGRRRERGRERDMDGSRENERRMLEHELEHERELASESEREREYEREQREERESERKRAREYEREHERDMDREHARSRKRASRRRSHDDEETNGQVEDLSVARRQCISPAPNSVSPHRRTRSPSYSPPPAPPATQPAALDCGSGVIKLATTAAVAINPADISRCSSRSSNGLTMADTNISNDEYNETSATLEAATTMTAIKREIISSDDGRND
ncbi:broad-complex core protein isoform X2 [Zeugodacus cucurbitae]|nr:broad-complex core protein isoform X2 [Zeugodacus cucurbitae]XP_028895296.2 broad-complex core protein isoform X2 [Zeugodacus cucurbitae]